MFASSARVLRLANLRSHVVPARVVNRAAYATRSSAVMSVEWRTSLDKSLEKHKDVPIAKFFQLATVRANGKPANRTMVFRGFLNDSQEVTFVTDHRTEKLEEINNKNWAEICWYFPESKEQYRIGGEMTVIDKDTSDESLLEARKGAWEDQGPNTRKWYAQPHPGKPRDQPDEKYNPEPPKDVHDEFVLVVLDSAEVDYVNLSENKRASFTSTGSGTQRKWNHQEINP